MIAAMNPCKCSYLGNSCKECIKVPKCASDYQMKVSGPIMDRFDLHIEVSSINVYNYDLIAYNSEENSRDIAARVEKVRLIQDKRYEEY
ncbi:MAG: ATP-binding protein [Rickettsia endosymbiont of Ixodes persulcatus]|nr:ATP-binding protein [Rickettsia endosymbiont of Ixodes persulcatus]MCZ6909666.1 ATP-binding protein [Rickettsia endosymbiont of Ixodes persulcatus]MCZ6924928.1 ATP-binding protein [Rickettsia endosymbiont of Ixodes persulcatus]